MIPLNILCSFSYFTKQIFKVLKEQDHSQYRLMIDSGAFTAHMSGEPIKLDDYCKLLDTIECLRPFDAIQLDVIGDHEASLKNFEIMKSRGYNVMPVFTRGAPIELIDHLFRLNDYILIGGVAVGERRFNYMKYLIPKIKNKKVHLLGFTNLDFIKAIKPYSVDSSSWAAPGRYGGLALYNGLGKVITLDKKQVATMPFYDLCKLGLKSGLKPDELSFLKNESAWKGGADNLGNKAATKWLGAYAYIALAQDIEKNISTKSYHAISNDLDLRINLNAYELYKKNNPNRFRTQ